MVWFFVQRHQPVDCFVIGLNEFSDAERIASIRAGGSYNSAGEWTPSTDDYIEAYSRKHAYEMFAAYTGDFDEEEA